ncbi:MAG: hypothetical protein U0792_07335 [Gemmataceae bacterium]
MKEEPLFSKPLDELLGGNPSLPLSAAHPSAPRATECESTQSWTPAHQLGFALAALHLIALFLILVELCLALFGKDDVKFGPPASFYGPFLIGPAFVAEVCAMALRRRSTDARTMALAWFATCLMSLPGVAMVVVINGALGDVEWFALCLSTLLFVLGALGLWGLTAPGSREEFGITWRNGCWRYPE